MRAWFSPLSGTNRSALQNPMTKTTGRQTLGRTPFVLLHAIHGINAPNSRCQSHKGRRGVTACRVSTRRKGFSILMLETTLNAELAPSP